MEISSIKLTKEQKDKLLEMCNSLFPEYDYFQLNENLLIQGLSQKLLDFENRDWFDNYNEENKWNIDNYNNWELSVHWFEFCVKELSSTLAFSLAKTDILMDFEWESFINKFLEAVFKQSKHPIDYLYTEFKKLK